MTDIKQYATELLATSRGRNPKEPIMLLAERAKAIAEHILNGPQVPVAPKPKVDFDSLPSRVKVKNPQEVALSLLQEGPLKITDLSMALGHVSVAPTKSMVKALVKAKKVTLDEKTFEVKLVA